MIKQIMAAAAVAATVSCAVAQEFSVKPDSKGMELNLPVSVKMTVPNDRAAIVFSVISEAADLATAQSEVNSRMTEGQKAIKDFSSIAKIFNAGYSSQPIYTAPKKGQAPEIARWRAVQTIRVETEDVDGVASLVQVGQQANLALDNVSFRLSDEAKAAAQDSLSKSLIESLNRKVESIALAMKVSPEAFHIEKLSIEPSFSNNDGVVFAARAMAMKAAPESIPAPTFESGTSNLTMSASAVLKTEAKAE